MFTQTEIQPQELLSLELCANIKSKQRIRVDVVLLKDRTELNIFKG